MRVIERMRPGLGSSVTVHAEATSDLAPTQLDSAVDSAFHAIAQVDRLTGPGSSERCGAPPPWTTRTRLHVHGWTYEVLREAHRLWQLSGGAFDCNVGAALMRGGLLPKSAMSGIFKRDCPYGAAVESLGFSRFRGLLPVPEASVVGAGSEKVFDVCPTRDLASTPSSAAAGTNGSNNAGTLPYNAI